MENHPHNQARSSRNAGLFGGVVGTLGLTAAIFAMSATAGAAAPVLQAQDTDPAPTVQDVELNEDAFAADDEAWASYDECINQVFEDLGIEFSDVEALEADMLDGEIVGLDDFGTAVSIMDGEDLSFAEFGEGDGTITINKTGDEITVDTAGDVTVEAIDWDEAAIALEGDMVLEGDIELNELSIDNELDNELSGCDDKLPEGFDLDTGYDLDAGFEVAEAIEAAVLTEG